MWKRLIRLLWSLLVCTLFAQAMLTSVLALGWVYRWVRHSVTKRLFDISPVAESIQWHKFASNHQELTFVRDSPRLLWRQVGAPCPTNAILKRFHGLFHSLWLNLKIGVVAILTTWSFTIIPCIFWAMAWYTGWHISFNKMYEESATGASLGFLGMVLFTAVMLYLPSAQARHAFTGDWQSFFDVRFVRTLLCRRPLQLLLLALGYAISSVVLTFFKALPVFLPAINPALEALSAAEALEFLNDYYFYTGLVALLLFFILKTAGGRIYSGALVEMWRGQILAPEDFHPQEIRILKLLEITYGSSHQNRGRLTKIIRFPFSMSYQGAIAVATCLVWGIFSFMPFISEFANYYPVWGFLNQPLVQLPCFRYVPAHLEQEAAMETTEIVDG